MEKKSKVATFIGFAIRSFQHKIGLNAIATLKRAHLVIICKSTGKTTKDRAISLAKKFNCPILLTEKELLEFYTFRKNAKVMAITDKALSKAILENAQEEFTLYQENIHG